MQIGVGGLYIRLSDMIVHDAGQHISNLDVATKFWDTYTGTSHPS